MKQHEEEDLLNSIRHIIEAIDTLQSDLESEREELDNDFFSNSESEPVEKLTQKWVEKIEMFLARKNLLEYYRWELGFDLYYQLKQIGKKSGVEIDDPVLDIALGIFREDAEAFFRDHAN